MKELVFKWGTLKAWDCGDNAKCKDLINEYYDIGACVSVMAQKDTPRQKEILWELIDLAECDIWNDWDGVIMCKRQAKDYVMGEI